MPTSTWIVAADSSRARVFEIADLDRRLREIEEFDHPRGRAHNREINAEPDGRFFTKGGGPGTHTTGHKETPVDHENELFSKRLARYLDKARVDRRFDKLYLIAPPEFLGLMRENLSKEVRKLTAEEINKDLSWFEARDIERFVRPLSRPEWAREKPNGGKARAAKSVLRAGASSSGKRPARRSARP